MTIWQDPLPTTLESSGGSLVNSGGSLGSSGGSFKSNGGSLGVVVTLGSTGGSLVVTLDYKPAVLGLNLPIFPA